MMTSVDVLPSICSAIPTTRTRLPRSPPVSPPATYLPFSAADKKALKRDREYICSEYAWECYKTPGIRIDHDKKGFIAPADFAKAKEVKLQAVLKSSR